MLDRSFESFETLAKTSVAFDNAIEIVATSCFVPDKIIPNEYFAERAGVDLEWIKSRTGILERRFVENGQSTTSLAMSAAKRAISSVDIDPSQIGLILVATSTADRRTPSTAVSLQHELGLSNAWGFDVSAGCSGFLYALASASSLVAQGAMEYALVIGVECLSKHIDWTDKKSCMLFGDGAGAVIIKKGAQPESLTKSTLLKSWSDKDNHLIIDKKPGHEAETSMLLMNGREVFRQAVNSMTSIVSELLDNLNVKKENLDHLIIHQANARILDSVRERLGLQPSQVPGNIESYGNTGAASIPILLHELVANGKIKKNDLIVFSAFGAGFTTGAIAYKW